MQVLRSKTFDFLWGGWTAVFGLFIPVLALLGRSSYIRKFTRIWVRGIFALLRGVVGLGFTEHGKENLPQTPCLIVSNHQSTWETLAYLILFPDMAIVAKEELLRIPVFGWYLRHSPMITIDRETGTQAVRKMVEEARKALQEGRSVLIFPEGTRKAPEEPIEFKRGVEMLYSRLDVPVLPVVVNSGSFWGIGRSAKRPGAITVSYLAPIPPGLSASEMTQRARDAMEAERQRLLE